MPTFREDTKIGCMVPLIKTDDYSDRSVTEKKLADGAITTEKLSKNVKDLLSAATGLPDDLIDSVGSMDSHFKDLSNRFPVKGSDIDVNAVSYDKLDKSLIVGQKGDSERSVMSQGAVSRELESLESNIPVPDEEDLTSIEGENNKLMFSFADRPYSPQNFIGKGYKILRKNIKTVSLAVTKIVVSSVPTSDGYMSFIINGVESHVDVVASTDTTTDKVAEKIATKLSATMTEYEVLKDASTITLTRKFDGEISTFSSFSAVNTGISCTITDSTKKELRNILTQNMINQPNTTYEIRYDFDLNGAEITIPEDCVLNFQRGSLNNGTIVGSKTKINAPLSTIFKELLITGIWDVVEVYPEWFGAVKDTNSTDAFKKLMDSPFRRIRLTNFYIIRDIEIYNSCEFIGGGLRGITDENRNTRKMMHSNQYIDIIFDNVNFDGGCNSNPEKTIENNNIISFVNSKSIQFNHCKFHNFGQTINSNLAVEWAKREIYIVSIFESDNVIFDSCSIFENYGKIEQFIISSYSKKTTLQVHNCRCYNNKNSAALFLVLGLRHSNFTNNCFLDNGRTFIQMLSDNVYIDNNIFSGTTSRGVTTEALGAYYPTQNIIITNNEFSDCDEGGINTGIYDISIKNNKISNCDKNRGSIIIQGIIRQETGELTEEAVKAALPYIESKRDYPAHINIEGNTIYDMNVKDSSYSIRINNSQYVDGFGVIESVSIKNNIVNMNKNISKTPIYVFEGTIENLKIHSNIINASLYKDCYIDIRAIVNSISITDNTFNSIDHFKNIVRLNTSTAKIDNIVFDRNILRKAITSTIITSAYVGGIRNIISLKDNETLGADYFINNTNQFEDGVVYIPSRSFVTDKRNIFPNKNMFFYKGDRIICNELASTGLFRFQETYTITYSGMNPLYTLSDVNVIEVISANKIKVNTSEGLFVGASIIINNTTTRILEVEDNLITVNTSISCNIGDSIKYSYCLYKHDNVTEAGYEPEGADIHNWDRLYQTQRDALLIYKNGWINIDGTQPIKVSII